MEIRPLGRTGVQVSSLCLGCMMFGRRTEPEVSYAIIDRALDAGINFLDTANVYNLGRSEEATGVALKTQWAPATERRPGDQGARTRWTPRTPTCQRHQPPAHHPAVRGQPAPPGHRLHRPLPAPPSAARHPHRRNPESARRPGPRRQGPLHRHQQFRGLGAHGVALGGEGARPQPGRLRAARLQPARPPRRERTPARGPHLRHRRHPLGASRRRIAQRAATSAASHCPPMVATR